MAIGPKELTVEYMYQKEIEKFAERINRIKVHNFCHIIFKETRLHTGCTYTSDFFFIYQQTNRGTVCTFKFSLLCVLNTSSVSSLHAVNVVHAEINNRARTVPFVNKWTGLFLPPPNKECLQNVFILKEFKIKHINYRG